MNLQAYHVYLPASQGGTAPSPGLLELASREIGRWPTPLKVIGAAVGCAAAAVTAAALAPIAIAAAGFEVATLATAGLIGTGAAGAALGGTGVAIADYYVNKDGGQYLRLINSKELLNQYKPFESLGLLADGFYIEHPRREHELVSAKDFHEIIEREQAQEILRFVRSKVGVSSIKICRGRSNTTKAGLESNLRRIGLAVDVSLASGLETLIQFTYDVPEQVENKKPFVWEHTYQELVDGLAGASGGGTVLYTLKKVGSFSLSAELVRAVKVNIAHLNDRYLTVEIRHDPASSTHK